MDFENYHDKMMEIATELGIDDYKTLINDDFPKLQKSNPWNILYTEFPDTNCSHFIKVNLKDNKIQIYSTKNNITKNEMELLKKAAIETKNYIKVLKLKTIF